MITDFGTKRKQKIRLLIQIVKNRSFISRKAEKSDSILKKWRKAKFVKCLKTAKMQSCFEILEFIAKRILYKSFLPLQRRSVPLLLHHHGFLCGSCSVVYDV